MNTRFFNLETRLLKEEGIGLLFLLFRRINSVSKQNNLDRKNMKNISNNIKTIIAAGLLALALVGTVVSISDINNTLDQVARQDQINLDMEKSISVLP